MENIVWAGGTLIDSGKMVQVYVDNTPFLLIDSYDYSHAGILQYFLERREIPFTTKQLDGATVPKQRGVRYRLAGAGCVWKKEQELWLYGESLGYSIRPNVKHIAELNKLNPPLRIRLVSDEEVDQEIRKKLDAERTRTPPTRSFVSDTLFGEDDDPFGLDDDVPF